MTDGVEYRAVDYQLQTVEHSCAVNKGRIVAIDAGGVERCDLTVPLVDPLIRQLALADGNHGIYHRVDNHFDNCRAVASVRCQSLARKDGVLVERVPHYRDRLTLDDMLLAVVVIRLVSSEVEDDNRVATIDRCQRIAIHTVLREFHTPESVEVILAYADAVMQDSGLHRQYGDDTYIRAVIAVVGLQVFGINAALVDAFLEQSAVAFAADVVPCVRSLALADSYRVAEQVGRMDYQRQAVYTVASMDGRIPETVTTLGVQRIVGVTMSESVRVSPDIRRVYVGNMYCGIAEMTRIDIQCQGDDAVASMDGGQCIVVQTRHMDEPRLVGFGQTEPH